MKLFDFNVHLPPVHDNGVNSTIEKDLNLDVQDLMEGLEHHESALKNASGVNFLLFNTDLLQQDIQPFLDKAAEKLDYLATTALIDFRRNDLTAYMEKAGSQGVNAIMVNSYLQKIEESDFDSVLKACRLAEANNISICIDGSFGTSKMYTYHNLKLACYIADHVANVPIVIVHGGGYRVIEAMLLALDKPNVWLDTSFSLPFFMNSSREQDFYFVMEKMDYDRIVFGTDHPYCAFEEAFNKHMKFFEDFKISQSHQQRLFFDNAIKLFGFQ